MHSKYHIESNKRFYYSITYYETTLEEFHKSVKSYREFHISGDLLIIYIIEDGYLKLIRIGTHAQLFE